MPLISDAAFHQSPEARREEARAALQRPTAEQIGRRLISAAVHGGAFDVAARAIEADAPPVTREPPPDGYPVADEPAEGTGEPKAAQATFQAGDRVRLIKDMPPHKAGESGTIIEPGFQVKVEFEDGSWASVMGHQAQFYLKKEGGEEIEGRRAVPEGHPDRSYASRRQAQTPDEENQLRALGWSDDAITSMSSKQIESILQKGRKNPKQAKSCSSIIAPCVIPTEKISSIRTRHFIKKTLMNTGSGSLLIS